MSFPTIIFKHNNTRVENDLHILAEQKLSSLSKYIGDETDVKCEVEFERITSHHSGDTHCVEVNLWLAGEMYRATSTKETFEAAIDIVRDELERIFTKVRNKG